LGNQSHKQSQAADGVSDGQTTTCLEQLSRVARERGSVPNLSTPHIHSSRNPCQASSEC